jgi:iron complex transport system ATP-binding protein
MTPDLVVEALRVDAGRRTLLAVGGLSVAPGEVVAIVGPNGAGKTMLLRTCLGLRRAAAGRVTLLGQPVTSLGALALTRLRRQVGYVPQEQVDHGQMPLTVREVVAIGRTGLAGLLHPLGRADWAQVDAWIARLGLETLRAELFVHLSGGEQRKVLLARAMVQQPRMLVLDEPTAYLDLGWREQIVTTLDRLCAAERPTVILVCHELEVLPACCRRLILLQHGCVVADGTPEEVLTPQRLLSLYGPGLRVVHAAGRHAVVPTGSGEARP